MPITELTTNMNRTVTLRPDTWPEVRIMFVLLGVT